MAWAAAVFAAVGALMEGRAQANELRDQANVEKYNAGIAEQQAAQVGQQASAEQERVLREGRNVMGSQRAAMAQSGTSTDFGSNVDIMRQSTANMYLDQMNVQYGGEVDRLGLLEKAKMHMWNRDAMRKKARSIMYNRWIKAAGSAMSAYGGAGGSFGGSASAGSSAMASGGARG